MYYANIFKVYFLIFFSNIIAFKCKFTHINTETAYDFKAQ